MKYFSLFFLLFFSTASVQAQIWSSDKNWDVQAETAYSNWVKKNINSSFFRIHKLKTDCADAAIAIRWIYAYENKLPALATLTNGTKISNLSVQWNKIEKGLSWKSDQRFLTALDWIQNSTNTNSLMKDLEPISINASTVKPGILYMNSSHVEWVSNVNLNGFSPPITLMSSTSPRIVRDLLEYPFAKTKWPSKYVSGFYKFKWPKLENSEVSYPQYFESYKSEQFNILKMNFDDFVTTKLIGHPVDSNSKLIHIISHLTQRIDERIQSVETGARECRNSTCAVDSERYYNFSTYSRDAVIQALIIQITELIYNNQNVYSSDDQIAGQMVLKWSQAQTENEFLIDGKLRSLGELVNNWNSQTISSNPNDTITKRWGFSK